MCVSLCFSCGGYAIKLCVCVCVCVVCVVCVCGVCVCVCWQAKHSEYECEKQKAESVLQHYRDRVGEIDSIISSVEIKVYILLLCSVLGIHCMYVCV